MTVRRVITGTDMRILTVFFLLLVAPPAVAPLWAEEPGDVSFERSELVIETSTVARRFTVELALTPRQTSRGLMYRREMPLDRGMLLVFEPPREVAIWMRNTYIPLDLIYIRADGTVHRIHYGAVPHDETPIPSEGPVAAVLEVNAGVVRMLGVRPGDVVRHELFGTAE